MTTETDHTHSTEPDDNWIGYKEPMQDAPFGPQPATEAAPEELADPEPDQPNPPAASAEYEGGLAPSENGHEPVATATDTPASEDHLLTPEAERDLLSRWTEIQISFVEDPRASVQEADALVERIATTVLASIQERRSRLAAEWQWQNGQPDTEQLRLALRQYRSFVSTVLPV